MKQLLDRQADVAVADAVQVEVNGVVQAQQDVGRGRDGHPEGVVNRGPVGGERRPVEVRHRVRHGEDDMTSDNNYL